MPWDLKQDRPIFTQIIEKLQNDILSGAYLPGERLPSVRELAQEAAVNPNTMQKALARLEQTGIVYTQRTSGRFITEDTAVLCARKEMLVEEAVAGFVEELRNLGFQRDEIIPLLEEALHRSHEEGSLPAYRSFPYP
ncbi:GntR family transcriptional regulator [Lachnospiraceae bacterium 29-84]